jgi:hypothetical protein
MRKYGDEIKADSGKWIDSSVWHGKPHTWDKIPWLIKEVRLMSTASKRIFDDAFDHSGSGSRLDVPSS